MVSISMLQHDNAVELWKTAPIKGCEERRINEPSLFECPPVGFLALSLYFRMLVWVDGDRRDERKCLESAMLKLVERSGSGPGTNCPPIQGGGCEETDFQMQEVGTKVQDPLSLILCVSVSRDGSASDVHYCMQLL